jgi:probable HAF family extracellular repeat protein
MRKHLNLFFFKLFRNSVRRKLVYCLLLCNFLFAFALQASVDYSFISIDVPGSFHTFAQGINDARQVVGYYLDATSGQTRGFLYSEGTITTIDFPGSFQTWPYCLNNAGQIVGYWMDSINYNSHGFLYSNGTFTSFDVGVKIETYPYGINNLGQIVGNYNEGIDTPHGFLYSGGTFTIIDFPGSNWVVAYGINDTGQIAGMYFDTAYMSHGFLYKEGTFTSVDFPGAGWTRPQGINNPGQIVGYLGDTNGNLQNFSYSEGTFSTINIPGALYPVVFGINNAGQIVGYYSDANGRSHGFLATAQPPVILLDPVDTIITPPSGKGPSLAMYNGKIVKGVSADGITQVIVRIPANSVGEELKVSVIDEIGNPGSVQDDGGLTTDLTFGTSPGLAGLSVNQLTVTAEQTTEGPMAFVVYSAPTNFVRDGTNDAEKSTRAVSLKVRSISVPTYSAKCDVQIFRPPVVLVHGLWGSRASWNGFNPFLTDQRFFIVRANYSDNVPGVTSTSPSYSNLNEISANTLGFAFNAPSVEKQVRDFIKNFRTQNNIAAIQADLVAHSMGGDVSLTMGRSKEFNSTNTYNLGPIHKLITIGTPYLGSPLASGLMKGNNCVRNLLASDGSVSFKNVSVGGMSVSGAVHDLDGDGTGKELSPALKALQGLRPFPYSQIAGIENDSNLQELDCPFSQCKPSLWILRTICGTILRNPIAKALTRQGWPKFFKQESDGIVPLSSQLNGEPGATGAIFDGVIHTEALKDLGFVGPTELEFEEIQSKVIDLLNKPNNGPDFH